MARRRRNETADEYFVRTMREEAERRDERLEREQAEHRERRRNEVITRGEILDVLDRVIFERGGNCLDWQNGDVDTLRALREAFE